MKSKTNAENLRRIWKELKAGEGIYLNLNGQAEWQVRRNEDGYPEALMITDISYNPRTSLENIQTEARKLGNSFCTAFTLINKDFFGVFSSMVADLVVSAQDASSYKEAIQKVNARFKNWEKLFARSRGRLSVNELRGLAGELLELKRLLENPSLLPGKSKRDITEGWIGPFGADQDFDYGDVWIEVKTTLKASSQLSISSLEQLDRNNSGILAVYRMEKTANEKPGVFTIGNLINKIQGLLWEDPEAAEVFADRLMTFGIPNYEDYSDIYLTCWRRTGYETDPSFPKLTRNSVPNAIAACSYSLNLSALEKWKTEEERKEEWL